ncbi:MAG: hypothetical protein J6U87_02395 [Clostridia bacterium]|nr:hypothetical protein [Clostridia bacterium]
MGIKNFFKKAFRDMKEDTKAQHEVTKANFAAAKAESRATWEEAKMTPAGRRALMQDERDAQIAAANERREEAQSRIELAKSRQKQK